MNIRMLSGLLLVTRDPEETFKDLGGGKRLFFPDDMASSNVNSWAASDRLRCSAFCHVHEPSARWIHDPILTGRRVYFEKWTEKTFEYKGHTFHVLDERGILAYEERPMNLKNIADEWVNAATQQLGVKPEDELNEDQLGSLPSIDDAVDVLNEGEEGDEGSDGSEG